MITHARFRESSFYFGTFASVALVASYVFRRLLVAAGTPNFLHDWAWSPATHENVRLFEMRTSLLSQTGLNGFNVHTLPYASLALFGWLDGLLGSELAIKVAIISTFGFAAISAAHLARTCGANRPAASCIGAIYALGPYAFTEIAAGHVNNWVSFAVLPEIFALALLFRFEKSTARVGSLGILLGLASGSLALWIATCVILLALGLVRGVKTTLAPVAIAIALSVATQIASFITLWNSAHQGESGEFTARTSWQVFQSPDVLAAFALTGYFTHYYEKMLGAENVARPLFLTIAGCALVGLFVRSGRSRGGYFAGAAIFAVVALVSAYHFPWRAPVDLAFRTVSFLTIFRELYGLLAIIGVLYAIGLARFSRIAVGSLIIAICALGIVIVDARGDISNVIHSYDLRRETVGEMIAARLPFDARLWPDPNGRYQSLEPGIEGGYDPFAERIGEHAVVEEYFPSGIIAAARAMNRDCRSALFRAMRIGIVWNRKRFLLHAKSIVTPSTSTMHCDRATLATTFYRDASNEITVTPVVPAMDSIDSIEIIPDSWMAGARVISQRKSFIFAKDAGAFGFEEHIVAGTLLDNTRYGSATEAFVNSALDPNPPEALIDMAIGTSVTTNATAISGIGSSLSDRFVLTDGEISTSRGRPAPVSPSQTLMHRYECGSPGDACRVTGATYLAISPRVQTPLLNVVHLKLPVGLVIVTDHRQYIDESGEIDGRVVPHFVVDGYANGWLVPRTRVSNLIVVNRTLEWIARAWVLAMTSWSLMALVALSAVARRLFSFATVER